MSRNAYALFEKKYFWKWGGDMRCSSEMGGGHQTIIKNGGVYTSAAENGGGTHARPKAARKRVPPPQGVFCTFPKRLGIGLRRFDLPPSMF